MIFVSKSAETNWFFVKIKALKTALICITCMLMALYDCFKNEWLFTTLFTWVDHLSKVVRQRLKDAFIFDNRIGYRFKCITIAIQWYLYCDFNTTLMSTTWLSRRTCFASTYKCSMKNFHKHFPFLSTYKHEIEVRNKNKLYLRSLDL